MRWILVLALGSITCLSVSLAHAQQVLWMSDKGIVSFSSDAPLEIIKAKSHTLRGVINPATKSFAFTMNINSFEGFNSEIQQTHFIENYLEGKKFPTATFTGKLIEDIPFDIPGTYSVRAKGKLDIHGVIKERIIRGTIIVRKDGGRVETQFSIPLADHGIAIPQIVQQKISDEIEVIVQLDFIQGVKS